MNWVIKVWVIKIALSSLFNNVDEVTRSFSLSWSTVLEITKYLLLALSKERCVQQPPEALQPVRVIRQAEFTVRQKKEIRSYFLI